MSLALEPTGCGDALGLYVAAAMREDERRGEQCLRAAAPALAANLRALADELEGLMAQIPEGTLRSSFMHFARLQRLDDRLAKTVRHLASSNGLHFEDAGLSQPGGHVECSKTAAELRDEARFL